MEFDRSLSSETKSANEDKNYNDNKKEKTRNNGYRFCQ